MKNNQLLLLLILLFIGWNTNAQGDYLWAKSIGGNEPDQITDVSTDPNGNVFITGYFYSSTITFGSITLTNSQIITDPKTPPTPDVYIVKYDASGNVLWAKSGGASGIDYAYSIALDSYGNAYVTGKFTNAITFGSTQLISKGSFDIFIVKYDPAGNVVWAKSAAGNADDSGTSIAIDTKNNVLIGGYFGQTLTFDTIQITTSNLNSNYYDAFLAKLDSSGNLLWIKSISGNASELLSEINTDVNGNILVTGSFTSDTLIAGSFNLINTDGASDMYLIKYDPTGNVSWVRSSTGSENDFGRSVSTDAKGNVFVTGNYRSPVFTLTPIIFNNAGIEDVYLVKYDPAGNLIWARRTGGIYNDFGTSVSADANGDVYITGYFLSDSLNFDSLIISNSSYAIYSDIYLVKYNASGKALWVKNIGSKGDEYSPTVHADSHNSLVLAGHSRSSQLNIGSTPLTGKTGIGFLVNFGLYTEIEKYKNAQEIAVYPNPVIAQVTININSNLVGSTYALYNCIGQEILNGKLTSEKTTVDWSDLLVGLYLIMVGENKDHALKVMKE